MRFFLTFFLALCAHAQTATISDTLTAAVGGGNWTGRITVSLNAPGSAQPLYSGTTSLAGWSATYCVGVTGSDCTATTAAGVITATLYANDAITPAGTSYSARFQPSRGPQWSETWTVSAGNTKLYQIRATTVPTPTTTFTAGQLALAAGRLLYGNASGVATALAPGANGHVLKLSAGYPVWAAESGGGTTYTAGRVPFGDGTSTLATSTSLNWTDATANYPTGLLTIGSGSQAFELSGRGTDSGATQGVPYFRSATTDKGTAFDVYANGYPTGTGAWMDVCGHDLQPLNSTDFHCGIISHRGRVWQFSNGSLVSIVVSGGTATVTTGQAHGLSSGAVTFAVQGSSFSPFTEVSTITVTSPTTFTFTSGKPSGTYTTGMVISEQGTINMGAHYSSNVWKSNTNIGGTIITLTSKVETGSGTAMAAFTDGVAAFKSGGTDKWRWSSSKFRGASDQVFGFQSGTDASTGSTDTGFSRLAAGSVALGNGTASDTSGTLTLQILRFASGTEPTCSVTTRGQIVFVQGGAGVADTLRQCQKDSSDNYAWTALD